MLAFEEGSQRFISILTLPISIPEKKKPTFFIFKPLCGASKGLAKALKALKNLVRHQKEVQK